MKRAVLCLLMLAAPILSAGQSDARVVKPEIRVGDSWTYRSTNVIAPGTHDYETRVSFAGDMAILAITTRKSDGKEFDSSWSHEWNAVSSYSGLIFRPSSGFLRFPMRVGDKYSVKWEVRRPRATSVLFRGTGTSTVIGWETVEVPAGKFRAVKIETEALWEPSDGSRAFLRKTTFWYNPEVRRWLKVDLEGPGGWASEELLEYKLNEE